MNDLDFGEAVAALPDKQRDFVLAFMNEPSGPDALANAADIAGISERTARRLLRSRAVLAALKELGKAEVLALAPSALAAVRDIIARPHSKDQLRAAQTILDRVDPIVQKMEVKAVDTEAITLKHLRHLMEIGATREVLVREFGEYGLSRYMAMLEAKPVVPVIDATPVVEAPAIEAKPEPVKLDEELDGLL
ncbi:MAG: hypothetical protein L0Z50_30995 [Verrucomicrobiales bacterium]|nr:hypothetical protein [Verrucomicrobiales bacterium]